MSRASVLAAVFLLSSGCGGEGGDGGGEKESTRYDPASITRCLKQRFGLVVDRRLRERSRWYGGNMTGRVSVSTVDPRDASPSLTPSADIGFAENESEAQKVERVLREGAALPLETVFTRKRNVVIVWTGPPPRKVRERVESCVAPSDSG